jgi:glycosyltransferase involved in cell wall biosynthesis
MTTTSARNPWDEEPIYRSVALQRSTFLGSPGSLRIAVVAPLFESVPPQLYGGTERVVSYLTEELVRQGHEVTLYASRDSRTTARLSPAAGKSLRLSLDCSDPLISSLVHLMMVDEVLENAAEYDIIHFNIDHLHLPACSGRGLAAVSTVHGRLDLPVLPELYARYRDMPLVSISDAQRTPLSFALWQATIHHGLPADLYPFSGGEGSYLAFLGRICPEKGVDRAIRIAALAGVTLRIAAKVDRADRTYFEEHIRPMLAGPGIEYIGEIGEAEKAAFLGGAVATLFPIDWPEPFGLVMIESMACGTPVIAYRRGSVPEIMEHGVTGFIVEDEASAAAAVARVGELDRAACRASFERRFTAERMARDYVAVYDRVIRSRSRRSVAPAHTSLPS